MTHKPVAFTSRKLSPPCPSSPPQSINLPSRRFLFHPFRLFRALLPLRRARAHSRSTLYLLSTAGGRRGGNGGLSSPPLPRTHQVRREEQVRGGERKRRDGEATKFRESIPRSLASAVIAPIQPSANSSSSAITPVSRSDFISH